MSGYIFGYLATFFWPCLAILFWPMLLRFPSGYIFSYAGNSCVAAFLVRLGTVFDFSAIWLHFWLPGYSFLAKASYFFGQVWLHYFGLRDFGLCCYISSYTAGRLATFLATWLVYAWPYFWLGF